MKQMRIVGATSPEYIWVQTLQNREWVQEIMTAKDFTEFVKSNFPKYYEEYITSNTKKSIVNYFYDYGKTEEMFIKGESYIFTA